MTMRPGRRRATRLLQLAGPAGPPILRAIAAVAGALARWAERQHAWAHATPDPGCRLCVSRLADSFREEPR